MVSVGLESRQRGARRWSFEALLQSKGLRVGGLEFQDGVQSGSGLREATQMDLEAGC